MFGSLPRLGLRKIAAGLMLTVLGGVGLIHFVGLAAMADALHLTSRIRSVNLQDGQVIQRSTTGTARVLVKGTMGIRGRSVEAGILGAGAGHLPADGWGLLDGKPRFGSFQGFVDLKSGWNHLFLRSVGDGMRLFSPLHVGVGEVFLVVGQSNASGSAVTLFVADSNVRIGQIEPSGTIAWRSGDDPQVPGGGGSVWPEVGRRLQERLSVPVAFVNVAVGGSSLADWKPGDENFLRMVKVIVALQPQSVRAILWHQGESDGKNSETYYYRNLKGLIAAVTNRTGGRRFRWMIATASYDGHHAHQQIRAAQQELCADGLAVPGPDTDVIGPDGRESAGVHFNYKGTLAAAALWYDSIARNVFELAPSVAEARESRH